MRKIGILLIVVFLLVLASCSSSSSRLTGQTPAAGSKSVSQAGQMPPAAAGRYIVVLQPGATALDSANLENSLSARPEHSYRTVFNGFASVLSPVEYARLSADPNVRYIEPDAPVQAFKGKPPGSPGGGGGGGEDGPPPQEMSWGYDRIDADLNNGSGGSGVTVAVIDTGINFDHPDLVGAVIGGFNATNARKSPEDDNGHGTHVAGIIAARDNTIGYIGVASSASLVAVKVLDRNGSGYISWVVAGIDWVAANQSTYGIEVANMSLGGSGFSQSMYDAIDAATGTGVTFVVAAGNSYKDAENYSPAGFDNVICVSALNDSDGFAYYPPNWGSNWGSAVDMIAPGVSIPSLWKKGGYKTISGTSMASPHVAGAAALWLDDDDHSGGLSTVLQALLDNGEDGPVGGWPNDGDNTTEPLVDAATL